MSLGRIVAALPVRDFATGKQRLAGQLTAAQRGAVVQTLLAHVVATLRAADVVAALAVTSSDPAVLDWARAHAVHALAAPPGLNPALDHAAHWAAAHEADALLVVLPDLPLLTVAAVRQLVALGQPHSVVLAPARDNGTNALLVAPPLALRWRFGHESAAMHRQQAVAAGLALHLCNDPAWAHDLDTPADLAALPLEHPLWRAIGRDGALS